MEIILKIKDVTARRLVSNDSSYRLLLEGIEGGQYAKEWAELLKLQEEGKYVKVILPDE